MASISNSRLVETVTRRFPDGELYVRVLGEVAGEDVVLVQSLGLEPDPLLVEYFLIVDALRGSGCKSVTAVIPYLAYARQDSRFNDGEPLSLGAIARLIEDAGSDRIITVDAHLHRFRKLGDVFRIPTHNVSAMPLLAQYYRANSEHRDVVVIGPDSESEQWAMVVAETLSAKHFLLNKQRLGDREVKTSGPLPVRGKSVVVVDDIVSTGGTLVDVAAKLKERGAKRIDVLVTHALLVGDTLAKLSEAGISDLISTDTVPGPTSRVSVAPAIVNVLQAGG